MNDYRKTDAIKSLFSVTFDERKLKIDFQKQPQHNIQRKNERFISNFTFI